ncbi:immunity 26/phosphotriesterase HocA family protein [Thomasclavelia cocleata]|uniref:immunity 26/phosphotriesterase HocA family protein n=1 Tax=Thomasclavelia cocleata TaxID=69824 RepID=UPI00255ADAF3|nr:immunity 26/phosphotriesterase HocA family protein [Thomasclavelia cocleata]
MRFQLIPIKRSNQVPKKGDIFVVQPIENIYYYGKVIDDLHKCVYGIESAWPLIYIYNNCSTKIELPDKLTDILVAPIITNYGPWTKGYFYTIGNIPITDEEKQMDCGFKDFPITDFKNENPFFRNIYGERIDYEPQFSTSFGLCSYKGVNFEICKALGIDD